MTTTTPAALDALASTTLQKLTEHLLNDTLAENAALRAQVETLTADLHFARGQAARVDSLDQALDDRMQRSIQAGFKIAALESRVLAADTACASAEAALAQAANLREDLLGMLRRFVSTQEAHYGNATAMHPAMIDVANAARQVIARATMEKRT